MILSKAPALDLFDYAALTTAMLRSQDIPCKLQIGYSGDVKSMHGSMFIRGRGWVTKAVSFDGDTWKLMDPTFDANSDGDEAIRNISEMKAIIRYSSHADHHSKETLL